MNRIVWAFVIPLTIQTAHAAEDGIAVSTGHADHGGHVHTGTAGQAGWTDFPLLKTKASGPRESMTITVVPKNIMPRGIDVWSNHPENDYGHRLLPMEATGARMDKSASGGFHWLAAREESSGNILTASTVYYLSEPGAMNPTTMFSRVKHELEITPQPYPREHSRYRAGEEWKFMVHFQGRPLPDQRVSLETSNGTRDKLLTDAWGVLTFRIPDDFREEQGASATGKHDHGQQGADFVLAIEHAEVGKQYLTAFNSTYGPDAFDRRSLAIGIGFTVLGMLTATPLLRSRSKAATRRENTANGED